MEKRRQFQGALNILSFNRHFYISGLAVLAVFIACHFAFDWPNLILWLVSAAFLYGLIMPLIVSAYVYDFSGYYNFFWLDPLVPNPQKAALVVNINAGFDETSFIIKDKFAQSEIRVFDFYNAGQHTEPAIKRARKVSLVYPNTQHIDPDNIPLRDKCADMIFLLSAVHEIRSQEEKVRFLAECHRLCKPGGQVIMVEHLRDIPNFLAFSVGFTHFFSRSIWKTAFKTAGFSSFRETKFTPFMSIFSCAP